MFNYKFQIEYDGTNYCGWQLQKNPHRKSIQEVIEKKLRKIFQKKIKLIASGRTDAGVHALAQVANFSATLPIPVDRIQRSLNGLLPPDIKISRVQIADADFHSRFDAESKIYRYAILNRPHPSALLRNTVYFYPCSLNIKLMQKELKIILGRHNFKSFAAADKKERDPVKTIYAARIIKEKDLIYIDIEADGFLYNMVRNIVGTLIEIGRGKLGDGSMKRILLSRNRAFAGPTAPAKGLCLIKVKY